MYTFILHVHSDQIYIIRLAWNWLKILVVSTLKIKVCKPVFFTYLYRYLLVKGTFWGNDFVQQILKVPKACFWHEYHQPLGAFFCNKLKAIFVGGVRSKHGLIFKLFKIMFCAARWTKIHVGYEFSQNRFTGLNTWDLYEFSTYVCT